MRLARAASAASLLLLAAAVACNSVDTGSGSGGTSADSGTADAATGSPDAGPTLDAGTPGNDGGTTGDDGGTPPPPPPDGGTTGDAGTSDDGGTPPPPPPDGGTTTSDCDGLAPATPGDPKQVTVAGLDRVDGQCAAGESDGTGHVVATWFARYDEGSSKHFFIDPDTAAVVGKNGAANLRPIGQQQGFEGTTCVDGHCFTNVVVFSPTGDKVYDGPQEGASFGVANDPTGGIVHLIGKDPSNWQLGRVEAHDAAGAVRWSVDLPPAPSPATGWDAGSVYVDREGNVLVFMRAYQQSDMAEWISHDGVPRASFQAGDPGTLFPRIGNGFFVRAAGWIGQYEPFATAMTPPPAWLASRPPSDLHMVRGGRGYGFFDAWEVAQPRVSPDCSQTVEVVSPSGQSCGTATFRIGGGSCTPDSIVIGYDGTVIQQLPFERDSSSCQAAGHICNCTWRFWPGFFR